MKRYLCILLVSQLSYTDALHAQAYASDVIAFWNFENNPTHVSSPYSADYLQTFGAGPASAKFSDGTGVHTGLTATSPAAIGLAPAFSNLLYLPAQPVGTKAAGWSDVDPASDLARLVLTFSTTGKKDIQISFDYYWATPRGMDVRYGFSASPTPPSTPNQIWTDSDADYQFKSVGTWSRYTINLSACNELEDKNIVRVQLSDFSKGIGDGLLAIDNLMIVGTPTTDTTRNSLTGIADASCVERFLDWSHPEGQVTPNTLVGGDERFRQAVGTNGAIYNWLGVFSPLASGNFIHSTMGNFFTSDTTLYPTPAPVANTINGWVGTGTLEMDFEASATDYSFAIPNYGYPQPTYQYWPYDDGAYDSFETLYHIGSHGRDKNGAYINSRCKVISTNLTFNSSGNPSFYSNYIPNTTLHQALWNHPDLTLRATLRAAMSPTSLFSGVNVTDANLAPKVNGLNIEGFAILPQTSVVETTFQGTIHHLFGLRNPLADNPDIPGIRMDAIVIDSLYEYYGSSSYDGTLLAPIYLDLGGRGIRSLDFDRQHGRFIIIAGSKNDVRDFAVYTWSGPNYDLLPYSQPVRVLNDSVNLLCDRDNPEGIDCIDGTDLYVVVSDDGALRAPKTLDPTGGGAENKDRIYTEQTSRSAVISIPGNPGPLAMRAIFRNGTGASWYNPYVGYAFTEPAIGATKFVGNYEVMLKSGPALTNLVLNFTMTGTATPGVDYTFPNSVVGQPTKGQVTIPAGSSIGLIPITIIGDGVAEIGGWPETMEITFDNGVRWSDGDDFGGTEAPPAIRD